MLPYSWESIVVSKPKTVNIVQEFVYIPLERFQSVITVFSLIRNINSVGGDADTRLLKHMRFSLIVGTSCWKRMTKMKSLS